MHAVIMAGGSGTRLWPLSRKALPKQFLPLFGEKSSFEETFLHLSTILGQDRVLVQAGSEYLRITQEKTGITENNYISEPEMRDNGPAIILAAIKISLISEDEPMAIIWADHNIDNFENYKKALLSAEKEVLLDPSYLLTIGVKPTEPDTGFGYIKAQKKPDKFDGSEVSLVDQFIEKPDLETATGFLESGNYLWNTGYKIFMPNFLLKTFLELYPEYREAVSKIKEALKNNDQKLLKNSYQELPKESIEYLITEKIDKIKVIPADLMWDDIGNWQILHQKLSNGKSDSVLKGNVIDLENSNCLIYGANKLIATYGLEDIIIVDTPDALLVCDRKKASNVKEIVNFLKENRQEKYL